MSKRVYTTANGRTINIDAIIAQNEESIAVGNMKVNARGDELGPGGKILRTKDKVMQEYYKLNTPVASDFVPKPREEVKPDLVDDWIEPTPAYQAHDESMAEQAPAESTRPLRGSLASSIAKAQPTQESESKKTGPTRI
jgi:hypothetical protein